MTELVWVFCRERRNMAHLIDPTEGGYTYCVTLCGLASDSQWLKQNLWQGQDLPRCEQCREKGERLDGATACPRCGYLARDGICTHCNWTWEPKA